MRITRLSALNTDILNSEQTQRDAERGLERRLPATHEALLMLSGSSSNRHVPISHLKGVKKGNSQFLDKRNARTSFHVRNSVKNVKTGKKRRLPRTPASYKESGLFQADYKSPRTHPPQSN
ncbi:hypothetical protein KP509_24G011300 [Ceratopteris richardii]|nr:hypothetical protein KP509_24G011300 [Ceratopteris richardii]